MLGLLLKLISSHTHPNLGTLELLQLLDRQLRVLAMLWHFIVAVNPGISMLYNHNSNRLIHLAIGVGEQWDEQFLLRIARSSNCKVSSNSGPNNFTKTSIAMVLEAKLNINIRYDHSLRGFRVYRGS